MTKNKVLPGYWCSSGYRGLWVVSAAAGGVVCSRLHFGMEVSAMFDFTRRYGERAESKEQNLKSRGGVVESLRHYNDFSDLDTDIISSLFSVDAGTPPFFLFDGPRSTVIIPSKFSI